MNLKSVAQDALSEYKKEKALDVILNILNGDVAVEDAALPNLAAHDKRFHGGNFDPQKMTCKLRKDLEKSDNPDAAVEAHEKKMATISNKKMTEYLRQMAKKCPNLDPEETLEKIAEIEDTTLQGDAFRWLMKGAVRLPEDMYKVKDARELAKKAKKDPFTYDTPQACINDLQGKFKRGAEASIKPIDPDTVPELSDKKKFPSGVTTYLVQDDQDGQQAMRKIIDTHWGKDANPWCLLARQDEDETDEQFDEDCRNWWNHLDLKKQKEILLANGYNEHEVNSLANEYEDINLDDIDYHVVEGYYMDNVNKTYQTNDLSLGSAWNYWNRYNALPKRIAFKDGKLLAFMATDGDLDLVRDKDGNIDFSESSGYGLGKIYPNEYDEYNDWLETEEGYTNSPSFLEWLDMNYSELLEPQNIAKHTKEQWWDRQDVPHDGIPIGNMPVPNDPFGRWANYEIIKGQVKQLPNFEKGIRGQDGYKSWYQSGILADEINKNQTIHYTPFGELQDYEESNGFGMGVKYRCAFGDDKQLKSVSFQDDYNSETSGFENENTIDFYGKRLDFSVFKDSGKIEGFERSTKFEFEFDKNGKLIEGELVDIEGGKETNVKKLEKIGQETYQHITNILKKYNSAKQKALELQQQYRQSYSNPRQRALLKEFLAN